MNLRNVIAVLLLAVLVLFGAPLAMAKKDKKADDEEAKWDVTDPPGKWQTIVIDTDETTWSDVDVNPDGRTIVVRARS